MMPFDWQDNAACRFTGWVLFYGPDHERPADKEIREAQAKAICDTCPVLTECREHALAHPEKWGYWAGMTEDERDGERRRRQRRALRNGAAA